MSVKCDTDLLSVSVWIQIGNYTQCYSQRENYLLDVVGLDEISAACSKICPGNLSIPAALDISIF